MMTMTTGTLVLAALSLQNHVPAPATRSASTPAPSASFFTLKVAGGLHGLIDVQAKQVETKAILERLKTELKLPFVATPIVANHKVDLTLKGASLATLLLSLAPVVLVDLEVGALPDDVTWMAIHLLGLNEKEPARALKQVGFLIMAGIPSETGAPPTEDPEKQQQRLDAEAFAAEPTETAAPILVVSVVDGRVSAHVHQQPLVAVLNEVASKAKVPFDLRGSVDMLPIDIELRDTPLQDLPVALGRPGLRLVVRRNLGTGEDLVQGMLAGDGKSIPSLQ